MGKTKSISNIRSKIIFTIEACIIIAGVVVGVYIAWTQKPQPAQNQTQTQVDMDPFQ